MNPGMNTTIEVYRARARFADVVAYYRACLSGREYPFRTSGRVSFRLDPPASSPEASSFVVIERGAGATTIRVECHGCD